VFYLEFRKLGIQAAAGPIGKNHNPCGAGVFDFRKAAIGGLIAILQNFKFTKTLNSGMGMDVIWCICR
jgi:hypothetical protein